jgi:transcriptional regulator with XRE-family HTH domain
MLISGKLVCLNMDARDALDMTIKVFDLKASDLAAKSGVTPTMLSRYRNKHQDLQSINAFRIVRALSPEAREYFIHLLSDEPVDFPKRFAEST